MQMGLNIREIKNKTLCLLLQGLHIALFGVRVILSLWVLLIKYLDFDKLMIFCSICCQTAKAFVQEDNFKYCPKEVLILEERLPKICTEIRRFSPDIICLQEVDIHDQLERSLCREPNAIYSSLFLPKPSSPCLLYEDNFGPDGMMILYKYVNQVFLFISFLHLRLIECMLYRRLLF